MQPNELREGIKRTLRYGEENAIKGDELAFRLGEDDTRRIRELIRVIRSEERLPIVSTPHPPYGYYIARTETERQEALGRVRHQALELFRTYRDLKRAPISICDPYQIPLLEMK